MPQKKLDTIVEEAKAAEVSEEYGPGNERWEMRPLSELMEPVLGKTPKRSEDEYWGGDIQWASAKDISQSETRHVYDTAENMTEAGRDASNAKILPAGTVVVVARGSVGEVIQLGEPMAFNQSCYALDTGEELLDDYLYYAWQYVFGQVQAVSYGTVFDTITMKSFADIEIPVPPVDIQRSIAGALTTLDDKIESNLSAKSLLTELSTLLFKSWFIDHTIYDSSKQSELGQVPESFRIEAIENICRTVQNGGTPKRSNDNYWGSDINWVKTGELGNYNIVATEEKISKEGLNESSCQVSPINTVLVGLYGEAVGKVGILKTEAAYNQACCALIAKDEIGYPFLYEALQNLQPQLKNLAVGSAQQNINQGIVREQLVGVPPEKDREVFNKIATNLSELATSYQKESIDIHEIRDILLPKLLSGKILLNG
ncbi:restriction endonuclease subunit S [Halobellus sp. GM3]|uniref:restriction endonuclease subunit S n=1 Tax=Halobellus sp. GM3 TaxID=3458410 RepID=UPI00403DF21A